MIAELFVEPRSSALTARLLGTDRHDVAYRRIRRLTWRRLGSRPAEFLFVQARVGVVVGVRLRDGRRVVVKVFQRGRRPSRALRYVQRVAADAGVPAPRPIVRRSRVWHSPAIIDELLPGAPCALSLPERRAVFATELARFIDTVGAAVGPRGLRLRPHRLPPADGALWPQPHDFDADFASTTDGAAWIDDHARRALAVGPRSAGDTVIGHGDWWEQNLGFDGSEVVAIYDWDDVVRDREPLFVGLAAITIPSGAPPEVQAGADPEGAREFVDAYERARRPFTAAERRAVGAAALYNIAYLARCEHARDSRSGYSVPSFRSLLARHGEEYLSI